MTDQADEVRRLGEAELRRRLGGGRRGPRVVPESRWPRVRAALGRLSSALAGVVGTLALSGALGADAARALWRLLRVELALLGAAAAAALSLGVGLVVGDAAYARASSARPFARLLRDGEGAGAGRAVAWAVGCLDVDEAKAVAKALGGRGCTVERRARALSARVS